ncbi:MAG: phenylalanine--tRNA ligase subunit beta [Chloroflexi bacterium]|nr:phenylalanine--tRNA ligase subunit beta [Chloroflexota bacterium]
MKVSLKWLREYVDAALPAAELARRLTMAGIEVKGVQVIGGDWDNIVIGQTIAVDPHPDADRLRLATVEMGTERLTVVCGAPNLKPGDKVAFARIGARLIDSRSGQKLPLKPAKIRGVVSRGMVCSEKELGISDNHEGIMVLPAGAPVGMPLADYLGDAIFDLEVTPNRPDCLSVLGVAREVAALTGQRLCLPELSYEEAGAPVEGQVSVEIAAADLCPRYCASLVTGVSIAESPEWIQRRLLACGIRPINNIVDITNYVMLEYGQPLHAFDYDKVRGRKIVVRRAAAGETIVTLDGVERTLTGDMLVIADTGRAVALAGVMGGANSEVTGQTSSILLEAANFNPTSIHHTGVALRLASEARTRFERGIRPELVLPAIKRATQLMVQLAGGKAAQGVIDLYPVLVEPKPIGLSLDEVKRVLGVELGLDRVSAVLDSLGFECRVSSASEVRATPPYWRSDIKLTVDLIEEVARIIGYDSIPTTMLSQRLPSHDPAPIIGLKRRARHVLDRLGFQEVITFSLTGLETLKNLSPESHRVEPVPIRVANPMTADQEYLRPTMKAGLLAALAANRRHEDGSIRLFELGRVYLPGGDGLPDEPEVVCGVLSGPRQETWWRGNSEPLDFFDAKGMVEGLLRRLGTAAGFEEAQDECLHPNRQTAVVIGDRRLGTVGEVHPRVLEAFEIQEAACLFEINLTALLPFAAGRRLYQPVPRFPSVVRDLALVVDIRTPHQQVMNVLTSFPLAEKVVLFDVYTGEQVPPGKKSLAYRVTYRSETHTLTDDEVSPVQQKILDKLSTELGVTLRA